MEMYDAIEMMEYCKVYPPANVILHHVYSQKKVTKSKSCIPYADVQQEFGEMQTVIGPAAGPVPRHLADLADQADAIMKSRPAKD
jgi:hypothetical protein